MRVWAGLCVCVCVPLRGAPLKMTVLFIISLKVSQVDVHICLVCKKSGIVDGLNAHLEPFGGSRSGINLTI